MPTCTSFRLRNQLQNPIEIPQLTLFDCFAVHIHFRVWSVFHALIPALAALVFVCNPIKQCSSSAKLCYYTSSNNNQPRRAYTQRASCNNANTTRSGTPSEPHQTTDTIYPQSEYVRFYTELRTDRATLIVTHSLWWSRLLARPCGFIHDDPFCTQTHIHNTKCTSNSPCFYQSQPQTHFIPEKSLADHVWVFAM